MSWPICYTFAWFSWNLLFSDSLYPHLVLVVRIIIAYLKLLTVFIQSWWCFCMSVLKTLFKVALGFKPLSNHITQHAVRSWNEWTSVTILKFPLMVQNAYQIGKMLFWPMSLFGLLEQGRSQLLLKLRRWVGWWYFHSIISVFSPKHYINC